MKTIAQQLNVTAFPFRIKDEDGSQIYGEDSDGFWWKREFDANGNQIYFEDSDGSWWKREYDSNGNEIYCEYSDGVSGGKKHRSAWLRAMIDQHKEK